MKILLWAVGLTLMLSPALQAESRAERRERQIQESAKPQQVAGGQFFPVRQKYDLVYDQVLGFLKKQGKTIETASKETGQITTAIEVRGTWRQTGSRVIVTIVKESDATVSVRAVVTVQKRFKALQVEPWNDPVVEPQSSDAISGQLQALFAAGT